MAAAALSRSRGVAGVRTTRGLFFIFTLLCLVCLASSLFDKNYVEKLKENIWKAEQQMFSLKAERVTISEIMNEYINSMEQIIAIVKKNSSELPDDFPTVKGVLESLKDFVEKTKTHVNEKSGRISAKIQIVEQKLGQLKKLAKFLETQQAEL